jgi:hypothetical protein
MSEVAMRAVKTKYDGKTIKVPKELRSAPPGDVLIVFQESHKTPDDLSWLKAQETSFARVWDNDQDAIYDGL